MLSMIANWVGSAYVYPDKKGDPNGRVPIDPVPADPAFREQLAETLWEMVRDGRMARSRNH